MRCFTRAKSPWGWLTLWLHLQPDSYSPWLRHCCSWGWGWSPSTICSTLDLLFSSWDSTNSFHISDTWSSRQQQAIKTYGHKIMCITTHGVLLGWSMDWALSLRAPHSSNAIGTQMWPSCYLSPALWVSGVTGWTPMQNTKVPHSPPAFSSALLESWQHLSSIPHDSLSGLSPVGTGLAVYITLQGVSSPLQHLWEVTGSPPGIH